MAVRKKSKKLDSDSRSLKCLVDYAESKHFTIEFARGIENEMHSPEKIIYINSAMKPREKIHTLLHELGHMLIDQQHKYRETHYPHGYLVCGHDSAKSTQAVSDIVIEEVEAWARGLKLARRLKLQLDESAYMKTRTHRLLGYFAWAADKHLQFKR